MEIAGLLVPIHGFSRSNLQQINGRDISGARNIWNLTACSAHACRWRITACERKHPGRPVVDVSLEMDALPEADASFDLLQQRWLLIQHCHTSKTMACMGHRGDHQTQNSQILKVTMAGKSFHWIYVLLINVLICLWSRPRHWTLDNSLYHQVSANMAKISFSKMKFQN